MDLNTETSWQKLVKKIWPVYRGVELESCEGGYMMWGKMYTDIESIDKAIDEAHLRIAEAINQLPPNK